MSYMERSELVDRAERQEEKIRIAVEDLWREWESEMEDRDNEISDLEKKIEMLEKQKDDLSERLADANSALDLAGIPTF